MIRFLINRPVAVCMTFLAFFILGIITYLHIPVSLLPDIPIPEVTVQITGKNMSARQLENTMVAPVRQQLLQVGKIRNIQSETQDGSAVIRLDFEYGVNTDLAFIEVNEKIDAAMNQLPRDMLRPRVVKANATDIPVFYLNLTLKQDESYKSGDETAFLELSELAKSLIKKRIEQLPQISMVDATGLVDRQILIIPHSHILEITGITIQDITSALQNNNIEPGSMTVKDGHYQYNISFTSVVRTIEDVWHIYLKKNNRILQLGDLAAIQLVPQQEEGISLYNGKRAITMGIIKQTDENMSDMKNVLADVITDLERSYPWIEFSVSRNQTELLDYTISNLQQNLVLAFIFVCLVSMIFMRDIRSPVIIGLSVFISLVISLLFFYLFNISLNIVSLTGLILAVGMMIDNSIIVTDNISQYRKKGLLLDEACVTGTNEVIAPMLSSSFTTIAVFIPLIFISGIAGAIFLDQAFSVTIGLLVSYVAGITLLPVFYKLVYSVRIPLFFSKGKSIQTLATGQIYKETISHRMYHRGVNWVFAHKFLTIVLVILVFPLCLWLFSLIRKEKMPEISQTELIVKLEWNENIHLKENQMRTTLFLAHIQENTIENSALIGKQQYLLNREHEHTVSESEIYLKVPGLADIPDLKNSIETYFSQQYPASIVTYASVGTIFDRIFSSSESDLRVEYFVRKGPYMSLPMDSVQAIRADLEKISGYRPGSIAFQKQLNLEIDQEKLLLYNVPYAHISQELKTGFKEDEIIMLRSYEQYLPIMLGKGDSEVYDVIDNTMLYESSERGNINPDEKGKTRKLPLKEFVTTALAEDIKTIVAGRNGEFIPFDFQKVSDPGRILEKLRDQMRPNNDRDINFSGSFFSDRKMLEELTMVLLISIMLMYFILAAQFESFVQPLIVLLEIPIAIAAALGLLAILGHSLNLMSAIGIIVTCGIIINDSILKLDIMNQLRKQGMDLMTAIHEAGRRRLNAILMTSLTSIVCLLPLLFSHDMGSELEKPLAIATIGGMLVGTPISLFVVPLVYWLIYRQKTNKVKL